MPRLSNRRRKHRFGENSCLDELGQVGHTSGMKTAISIPDDIFEEAERLLERLRISHNQRDPC